MTDDPLGLNAVAADLHALRVAGYQIAVAFSPGPDGLMQIRAEGDGKTYAATATTPAEAMAEIRLLVPSY